MCVCLCSSEKEKVRDTVFGSPNLFQARGVKGKCIVGSVTICSVFVLVLIKMPFIFTILSSHIDQSVLLVYDCSDL